MSQELPGAITVPYEEVEGSPVEAFDDEGFRATRVLECAWTDRLRLAEELRGGSTRSGATAVCVLPQRYPHYEAAVVSDVRVEPFGAPCAGAGEGSMDYELARLSVEYRVPIFGAGGDDEAPTLVTESLEPVAELLPLPYEKYYWDVEGELPLSESEAPHRLVRMLDWVYVRHQVLTLPVAVLDLVGAVNQSAVTSATLGLTFPAQTLLYHPPHLERDITTEGAKAWRVTFRFTFRPEGWNKFPRRGTEEFCTIYKEDGEALEVYPGADFASVLG